MNGKLLVYEVKQARLAEGEGLEMHELDEELPYSYIQANYHCSIKFCASSTAMMEASTACVSSAPSWISVAPL